MQLTSTVTCTNNDVNPASSQTSGSCTSTVLAPTTNLAPTANPLTENWTLDDRVLGRKSEDAIAERGRELPRKKADALNGGRGRVDKVARLLSRNGPIVNYPTQAMHERRARIASARDGTLRSYTAVPEVVLTDREP